MRTRRRCSARWDCTRLRSAAVELLIDGVVVQRGEAPLGVAERVAQAADVLETELDPERFEGEQAVEQFRALHTRLRGQD